MNKAEISVGITGDTSDIKKKVESLGTELRTSFSKMKSLLAGAFSVQALIGFERAAIDLGSRITDMSARAGVSTDAFQALSYAARMAGSSEEDMSAALSKVRGAIADALSGNEKAEKSFAAMGISLKDLAESNVEQIFERMATALVSAHSSGAELSAVFDLIGAKQAPKLLQVMDELGKLKLEGLTQEANNAGQVIEETLVKRLDELGDKYDRAKRRFLVLFGEISDAGIKGFSRWIELLYKIDPLVRLYNQIGAFAGAIKNVGMKEAVRQAKSGELDMDLNKNRLTVEQGIFGVEMPKSDKSGDAEKRVNRMTLDATLAERETKVQEKRNDRIKKLYEKITQAQEQAGSYALNENRDRFDISNQIFDIEQKITRLRQEQAAMSDEEKRLEATSKIMDFEKQLRDLRKRDTEFDKEDEADAFAGVKRKLEIRDTLLTTEEHIDDLRQSVRGGDIPASAVNRIGGTLGGSARPDIAAARQAQELGRQILEEVKRANEALAPLGEKIERVMTNAASVD